MLATEDICFNVELAEGSGDDISLAIPTWIECFHSSLWKHFTQWQAVGVSRCTLLFHRAMTEAIKMVLFE